MVPKWTLSAYSNSHWQLQEESFFTQWMLLQIWKTTISALISCMPTRWKMTQTKKSCLHTCSPILFMPLKKLQCQQRRNWEKADLEVPTAYQIFTPLTPSVQTKVPSVWINSIWVMLGILSINSPRSHAYIKQFKMSEANHMFIEQTLDEWLKLHVVNRSNSLYNSPLFCVPKKQGHGLRIILDFRQLNNHSLIVKYSMKESTEASVISEEQICPIFFPLNLTSGFYQKKSWKKTHNLWQHLPFWVKDNCFRSHHQWVCLAPQQDFNIWRKQWSEELNM